MSRIERREVFTFDELSDTAKEAARGWYREGAFDYEWWEFVYEDAERIGALLGIKIAHKGGGRRPEIYFSGFHHQGSGSSFRGTWDAARVQRTALIAEIGGESEGDKELLRLAEIFESLAQENPELTASIDSVRDYYIKVFVEHGATRDELLNSLGYQTPDELRELAIDRKREETLEEALEDFNRWIYRSLEWEWDWQNADEQVEEAILANEYEFTADGAIL